MHGLIWFVVVALLLCVDCVACCCVFYANFLASRRARAPAVRPSITSMMCVSISTTVIKCLMLHIVDY